MPDGSAGPVPIMPYSMIVGQDQLKGALELAYIAPRIEGVLLSGQRGTAKSTAVRAFSLMAYGQLPVTLPINATEDRVVGGLDVDRLLAGEKILQPGLLEEANHGLLYIDEVNLLDDHIVNIILDVASTGKLVIEREHLNLVKDVKFTMVGTMNPSEGGLRPQLLDRFSLMVNVAAEQDESVRVDILQAVLDYDAALALEQAGRAGPPLDTLHEKRALDRQRKQQLDTARDLFPQVTLPREMATRCVRIGARLQIEGHRGDYIMGLAARAHAARRAAAGADRQAPSAVPSVEREDLIAIAPLALQHRRQGSVESGGSVWTEADTTWVRALVLGEAADGPEGAGQTEAEHAAVL